MIENLLLSSKNTKEIIGLNFYGSSYGFYCGYVLDFNDDFVILKHFTKYGINDGVLVQKISDIKYIESETNYLKGIQFLVKNQNNLTESFSANDINNFSNNFSDLFESLIGNKDIVIKFELNDEEVYYGFVEWCDENYFSIINLDNNGITIGKAIFKFEDLKLYWIDDLESRKINLLYKSKKEIL